MTSHVISLVTKGSELAGAQMAEKGTLSSVCSIMHFEVPLFRELLAAAREWALELFLR